MLRLENLSKVYGKSKARVVALDDVTLSVGKSEFIFLVGPSGSGKSTLLHCMAGLEEPSSGKCFWRKQDVYRISESGRAVYRRKNIGFIFPDV